MKKKISNLLTIFIFSLALLEIYFYSGFVQKHFLISFNFYLLAYFFIAVLLFKFKKISLSPKVIKLNNLLFLPLLLFYFLLIFLEEMNYRNFIYGHFHLNPANFAYLPLISSIITFIYNNKKFQQLFYFLLPLFTVYLSQLLTFGSNFDFLKFSTIKSIVTNYFLWSCLLFISIFPFKKKKYSLFLYLSFFTIFILINRYKIKYLNVFFSLSDLKLADNLKDFLPFIFDGNIIKELISIILLFLTLIILIKKFYLKNNPPFKIRFLFFFISLFIIIYPIYFPDNYKNLINRFSFDLHLSNSINNCKNNGILFCFYDDFKNLKFPTPSNYNQSKIKDIYSNLESLPVKGGVLEPQNDGFNPTSPNIIVILSEALWDVTKLPQVEYSQDPIKKIRPDIKSTLVSPTYGGATANIEFEILTGFSNFFLKDRYPYNQLINQNIPSLFSLFKEQGYLTTAIHPFKRSMYRRPTVYKYFGLDKFISMEDMSSYEIAGSYISDKSFTQEIIKQFDSTDQSQFIFALSMQNHMPYETDRFSKKEINIKNALSQKDQSTLQSYVDGIKLSDDSYQDLKNYLKKSKKPTIVIFYGDHLPFLNDDFGVYKNLEFIPKDQSLWSQNDYQKMYTTPIAIWSNYQTNLDISTTISPNFLSLEILKLANIGNKYQFSFLQSLSQTDKILNKYLTPKFSINQLKDYELIQYDLVSGKQYGLE